MATVVRMPAVMAGAGEAALQSWLVAVGEPLAAGQSLAEIETEKAIVEYEAEASGVVAGHLVNEGDSVAVGMPIAVLAVDGESVAEALAAVAAELADAAPGGSAAPESSASPPPTPETIGVTGERRFISPLVRRLARERGLDLTAVQGSGPRGRIVRRDVEGLAAAALEPPVTRAAAPDAAPIAAAAAAPAPVAHPQQAAGFTDIPHTRMRRAIARRLVESKATVPHFYLRADCRIDELLSLRTSLNADGQSRITVNDLVVKAIATAHTLVPAINAVWTDDAVRRFDRVDIAIAVAVENGLLTPVVRGVDTLTIGRLSSEIRDLATRAREGRITQAELEGGTFSVSNLGMYGVTEFAAIINPPHAGILAVGAGRPAPVVDDSGGVAVATVMTVTLSGDHRVIDGAVGAEWLAAFQRTIEHPVTMLR